MKKTKKWQRISNNLFLRDISTDEDMLGNVIYTIGCTPNNELFLQETPGRFSFDFKVYGLEKPFIEKVKKTYSKTSGNLGILLNGVQGTGKTITGKILANELDLPIILVASPHTGLNKFLSQIEQDVIIFIDEYEKIFKNDLDDWDENKDGKGDDSLLSIMDGVFTTCHRKVFILTTNKLWISANMRNRPGRLRYLKEFQDLSRGQIEEIMNDCLKNKRFSEDIINYLKSLEIITVDIVKGIISEVNIFNVSPEKCCKDFNVCIRDDKYNIMRLPEVPRDRELLLMTNLRISEVNSFISHAENNWQTAVLYDDNITIRLVEPPLVNGIYTVYNQNIGREPKDQFRIRIDKVKNYHSSFIF